MVDNDDLKFVGMFLAEHHRQFVEWMNGQGFDEDESDQLIQKLDSDYEP